ncbi:MAG: hypothetical protein AB1801_21845, partial [Chloroflexota bacterium]
MPWWNLAVLAAANLALLLPHASPLRVAGAMLLIGLLPGWSWSRRLLAGSAPLLRWITAFGLSYVFTTLSTLLLSYLPGPLHLWPLLATLDALALSPFLLPPLPKPKAPGIEPTALLSAAPRLSPAQAPV